MRHLWLILLLCACEPIELLEAPFGRDAMPRHDSGKHDSGRGRRDAGRLSILDSGPRLHEVDASFADAAPMMRWVYRGVWRQEITVADCEIEIIRSAYCTISGQTIYLAEGLPLLPAGVFNEPIIQGWTFDLGSDDYHKLIGGAICTNFQRILSDVNVFECMED